MSPLQITRGILLLALFCCAAGFFVNLILSDWKAVCLSRQKFAIRKIPKGLIELFCFCSVDAQGGVFLSPQMTAVQINGGRARLVLCDGGQSQPLNGLIESIIKLNPKGRGPSIEGKYEEEEE